ncbi:MAG: vWA domain-containing protein, partial [Calditrichota bacterium]
MLAVALGFAIWTYRRTWPPVSPGLRLTLMLLRGGALVAGVLFMTHPLLEFSRKYHEPAEIDILIDRSASMELRQGSVDRRQQMEKLRADDVFQNLDKKYKIRWFAFADSLLTKSGQRREVWDLPARFIGSNLSQAWREAGSLHPENLPSGYILISDGAHNSGTDPIRAARSARTPIWTIGIGSTQPDRDLLITGVTVNPVVYQGSKTPVEIRYRMISAANENAVLSVEDAAGKKVAQKDLQVASAYEEGSVTFDLDAASAGRIRFTASVSPLNGELTTANNHRPFYLNVLANRMRVLILAGVPDNGLGDLTRRLKRDPQVELIQRTARGKVFYEGDWPDESMLSAVDVVVLHHFPIRSLDAQALRRLAELIIQKSLPVCFIDGGQIDYSALEAFKPALPVSVRSGSFNQTAAGQFLPTGRHAVIAEPEALDYVNPWLQLPPVAFLPGRFEPAPGSRVIAEFRSDEAAGHFPALVINETNPSKSAAVLARDMWRWGLASPGEEGVLEPFLRRLIRWLAVRKINKRITLEFDKEVYSNQEPIRINAFVQNENFVPIDGAEVKANIFLNDTLGAGLNLAGSGKGRYSGVFQP